MVLRPRPLGPLLGWLPLLKSNIYGPLEARSGSARPTCMDMFSSPGFPSTMTGKPKAEAQLLAPRRDSAGQAHPPELPAGQAELAPDLKPHPCLSYSLRFLLVAAGRTSLPLNLISGSASGEPRPGQNWRHRVVE